MKQALILFLTIVSLSAVAQNVVVSSSESFTLSKKDFKKNQITFEIENTSEQPFVAFDLKVNGKINNFFKVYIQSTKKYFGSVRYVNGSTASFTKLIEDDLRQLNQDIHFQNDNSWSSELQFLPINTKSIIIEFEKLGTKIETIDFNFFYPNKTENITKSALIPESAPPPPANCNCPIPAYEDRADWDPSGTHPAQTSPTFTTVTHLIVHHAAGPNTSSDWAATVRSIWNFHVNSNGWSDIGYNYLIDPNGIIYEGRGDNVLGAHFSGMNGGTMGVCLLGNYQPDVSQDVDPTQAMQNSLVELLAWKECDIDKDPLLSSFHAASNQTQMHISGHRDAGTGTVCPGDNVYDILPNIRSSCSAYLPNCAFISNADLVVSALDANPNPTIIADNTTLEVAVANGGNQNVIESLDIALEVDGNLVHTFTMDSIQAGEIIDFSLPNYQFTSIGAHQLCVYIDSASNETNTANNSFCRTVNVEDSVQFFSDIIIQDISINNNSPEVGESNIFTFSIKNTGDVATSETVDAEITINNVTKQIFSVPTLNINEVFTKTYTTSFGLPGTKNICINIDSPNNENNAANNSFCKNFEIEDIQNSIENIENVSELNMFPNPVKEMLHFKLSLNTPEKIKISITNSIGQSLMEKRFLNQTDIKETFSLGNLSSGVYFIQIEGEKTVLNSKIIKE